MSLFGDSEGTSSPWNFPEPKGPHDRIATLLADAPVPASYGRAFKESEPIAGFSSTSALRRVMDRTGLSNAQQDEVLSTLLQGSSDQRLSEQVWNVGMALIGLAQNGEDDLSLDSVDYNRSNLPEVVYQDDLSSSLMSQSLEDSPPLWEQDEPQDAGASSSGEIWAPKVNVDPSSYNPISKDTIGVNIVPEKEGVFMFRHVVYAVEGTLPMNGQPLKVVRRYSDFLWLLECLVKIYPFRLLPVLPPKRLAVDGRYLSSDSYFLERRRRGLSRFVNQLVKHPVLREEKLVQMFLTVDTEWTSWRKQSAIRLEEEFAQRSISSSFAAQWNEQEEMDRWRTVRNGASDSLEIISQLCMLADRIYKRQEAMATDYSKLANAFGLLTSSCASVYSQEGNEMPAIKEGLLSASRYSSNVHELLRDESASIDIGFLEDLKQLREMLGSISDLFSRYDSLGGNNIPQLEQRIQLNEKKIAALNSKPDTKPTEISRLKKSITNDKKSIENQTNRGWLIKECISQEIILCQRTQYQISKLLRDWASDNTKYSELLQNNWSELNNDTSHMPLI
jgi:sorting nexin-8